MTNHTTRTWKCNNKIWFPDDKQWLPGHVQLFPLFGRSNPLLILCHGMVKDCVGRAVPGDVACHIAPNRTMLSKRGPAFNWWGILSLLWVFHRLYCSKNCSSSCSSVQSHLPGQAQHARETDWQPCAKLAPAPLMLPAPRHCSSAAKFGIATPVSCNINTFICLTCALYVLQMLQQSIRDFKYSKHRYASKQESLPQAMRAHCDHVCRSSLLHGDSGTSRQISLSI